MKRPHSTSAAAEASDAAVTTIMSVPAMAGTPVSEDAAAEYGALFETHSPGAYRLALLLCAGEAALAEDALSEAFLQVLPRWRLGKVDDFGAYLRRAVANQVKSGFRSRSVRRRHEDRHRRDGRDTTRLDDGVADRSALWWALGQLPVKQRTAVVLHYYEDRPLAEIATTMGTSVGTTKSQLSRGRDRLRELLDDDEVDT